MYLLGFVSVARAAGSWPSAQLRLGTGPLYTTVHRRLALSELEVASTNVTVVSTLP